MSKISQCQAVSPIWHVMAYAYGKAMAITAMACLWLHVCAMPGIPFVKKTQNNYRHTSQTPLRRGPVCIGITPLSHGVDLSSRPIAVLAALTTRHIHGMSSMLYDIYHSLTVA